MCSRKLLFVDKSNTDGDSTLLRVPEVEPYHWISFSVTT